MTPAWRLPNTFYDYRRQIDSSLLLLRTDLLCYRTVSTKVPAFFKAFSISSTVIIVGS
jgi:hypothetical protein